MQWRTAGLLFIHSKRRLCPASGLASPGRRAARRSAAADHPLTGRDPAPGIPIQPRPHRPEGPVVSVPEHHHGHLLRGRSSCRCCQRG